MARPQLISDEQILAAYDDLLASGCVPSNHKVMALCRVRHKVSGGYDRVCALLDEHRIKQGEKAKEPAEVPAEGGAEAISVLTADDTVAIEALKKVLIDEVDKAFAEILTSAVARHRVELENTAASRIAVAASDRASALDNLIEATDRIAELESEQQKAIDARARAEGEASELRRQLDAARKEIRELKDNVRDVDTAERERADANRRAEIAETRAKDESKRAARAEAEVQEAKDEARKAVAEVKAEMKEAVEEVKKAAKEALDYAKEETAEARSRAVTAEKLLLEILGQRSALAVQTEDTALSQTQAWKGVPKSGGAAFCGDLNRED